ncbi:5-formyltetrahydrofolate cyclo-ligase [Campylobacter hyointestinalis]|nr:5-formyltetrahydrofolate cyclo-ligase [Campylobacter hyointestinalis]PPB66417.1 5-formyltetrahydrofolate cyclo-ligase [Campylobacter hyointestinalis subsp. hyointestinalis]PPB71288.1 5-formyltetrahydrofolate cyclo-ligase [Campylobacter hyointestinalis subsp. hyointestinalis]PPB73650.1 5-formyltetrahydrofolate cyclo-ligase [Campylobacter hyointestinalis subsp. hyointestinalis]PPB76043.1 5-formyltetrahydrofolate cyclo-ligase [Campylobacter hyointestinalis subsp. hyointestinalis]
MGVKFSKTEYRKIAKSSLNKIVKFRAKSFSYKIHKTLLYIFDKFKSKNILLFLPLLYEPNLVILRRRLIKSHNIFLPFMVDKSLKMVKLRLPFNESKFGVKEANDSNAFFGRIDVAVIPVIGVDGNMARIGHGFGYYDRFFDTLAYKPVVIFVQIEDFYTKEKICDSHDIKCDFYITPRKNYIKKGNYDRDFYRAHCRGSRRWSRVFCS